MNRAVSRGRVGVESVASTRNPGGDRERPVGLAARAARRKFTGAAGVGGVTTHGIARKSLPGRGLAR